MSEARYSIGIDLGTTHCALSFVDLSLGEGEEIVETMLIPQLTAPGSVTVRFSGVPTPETSKTVFPPPS